MKTKAEELHALIVFTVARLLFGDADATQEVYQRLAAHALINLGLTVEELEKR